MMMRRGSHRDERGQSTLEFIIIIPLMFLMISLVLYAGWWSYGKLSAQNAAYSFAVWGPRERPAPETGRVGNFGASNATLNEPIGMKSMWAADFQNIYDANVGQSSRLGGTGLTVAVSPAGMSWADYVATWEAVGLPMRGVDLPRGTAFFLYSPLISAGPIP